MRTPRPLSISKAQRVVAAVGLAVMAVAVIAVWGSVLDTRLDAFDLAAERVPTPGTLRLDARTGVEYTVYLDTRDPSTVVTVTGPDGRGLATSPALGEYRRGRLPVSAVATFTAAESGPHAVEVESPDGRPNMAFVADVNVPQERAAQVLGAIGLWLAALLGAVVLVLPLFNVPSGDD